LGILIFPVFGSIIPIMGNLKIRSVSDVLFTGVQKRLLGLLFGQPDRSFYSNEIAKLLKSGRGALQRELERLSAVGLINTTLMGRQKYYQVNKESFIYHDIRSIVIKTFGLADVVRAALFDYSDKIHCAFIYGSVAKGADTANSDIDLMVIAEDLRYSDLFEGLSTAEAQLGRKVSPTVYSKQEFLKKLGEGNHFVQSVFEQPKIPLIGNEDVVWAGKAEQS